MSEAPLQRNPHAAYRNYDGDGFIVVSDTGRYHIINPIGARVWELIDGARGVADIAKVIAEEYEVAETAAEQDVRSFVEDLRKNRMVV